MVFSQQTVSSPPKVSISKVIPSRPGAFLDLNSEMAVQISSSERGEDKSSSDEEVSEEAPNGETMGRSLSGTTSLSTWQFTTSSKCSAQRFSLSSSLCRVVPSLAIKVDEAGLENVFCRRRRSFIREPPLPCCSVTRARRFASARLLHQELRAFSTATWVSFLRWLYSVLSREVS